MVSFAAWYMKWSGVCCTHATLGGSGGMPAVDSINVLISVFQRTDIHNT